MSQMDGVVKLKDSIIIKALANMDSNLLDIILDDCNDDINSLFDQVRDVQDRRVCKFMTDLANEADRLQAEDDKKHYSPDDEYLRKHPDTKIFMSND